MSKEMEVKRRKFLLIMNTILSIAETNDEFVNDIVDSCEAGEFYDAAEALRFAYKLEAGNDCAANG